VGIRAIARTTLITQPDSERGHSLDQAASQNAVEVKSSHRNFVILTLSQVEWERTPVVASSLSFYTNAKFAQGYQIHGRALQRPPRL